jgi:hypothetical protein
VYTIVLWLERALLVAAFVFFLIHFFHLNADFPNNSPWVDWSKYTDEGWYGDAAIRHFTSGHWYWKGDFNPAVALPIWPAIEWVVFALTGVSPAAARATTLAVFAVTLLAFYILVRRYTSANNSPSLAPVLTVFLLALSPFFFVFERMAILEPLLICLMVLSLLCASSLRNAKLTTQILPTACLGILLPAMVLTKTTAIALVPALAWIVYARVGYRLKPFFRLGIPPAVLGIALWLAYYVGFVRPHYLEDYRYLFSANAYTGILLEPIDKVILNTITDGAWMGHILYPAFFVVLALMLFWRPRIFSNPLVPALLLWTGGYFAFLAYHNNLQPRYYLVVAAPITALVALGLDNFRQAASARHELAATLAVTAIALGLALPGALYTVEIATHPTYTFKNAADSVARIVRATPNHSQLILSISGSDITLFTHLQSIDDDFGTLDLGVRANTYQPGWYVAWNELDDDKMDALSSFHVQRVAAFPAMDDPDRNLLILYRLDPQTPQASKPHARASRTPKPLQTKVGQQPTTQQLKH